MLHNYIDSKGNHWALNTNGYKEILLQVQESGEQARISLTIEQAKQLERKLKEVIKKAENEKTLTDFLHN